MLKNATSKDKFSMLGPWMVPVVETIKRDLKNDHLRGDPAFVKKHFTSRDLNKLTTEEMAEAYLNAINEGSDHIAEFIINRWLIKHSDIYNYFAEELEKTVGEFTELQELEKQQATALMESAVSKFGAPKTYQFAVLNSVVFPKEVFDQLNARAKKAADEHQSLTAERREREIEIKNQKQFELEIARLEDKYEKKLAGLQKKYITDTAALRKQISLLQRKLENS